jgi:hypothetical protein
MPSSEMLHHVVLVRTDVSEERITLHHQSDKNRRTRNNVSSNYQPKYAVAHGVTTQKTAFFLKDRAADNIHNCDSYINIP